MPTAATTTGPWLPSARAAAISCAAGAALLLARPWLSGLTADETPILVAIFTTVGVIGAWWPLAGDRRASTPGTALVVGSAGIGAFVLGRLVMGGDAAAPATATFVVLNTLAAVTEEALFRRLVYGALARWGPVVAIAGSASAFALVHVTVWGLWVLPLDLAAGLVLSWQRWATGRWSVPAITHTAANLLAVIG